MPAKRSRTEVYILGLAVIAAALAAYYLPERRPASDPMLTPKAYIELVEQKKQERLQQQAALEQEQEQEEEEKAQRGQAADHRQGTGAAQDPSRLR